MKKWVNSGITFLIGAVIVIFIAVNLMGVLFFGLLWLDDIF